MGFEGCLGFFLKFIMFFAHWEHQQFGPLGHLYSGVRLGVFFEGIFKVVLGILRVFLGCLLSFLKVFPVFSSLETPLVRITGTLVMGNQFLLA